MVHPKDHIPPSIDLQHMAMLIHQHVRPPKPFDPPPKKNKKKEREEENN